MIIDRLIEQIVEKKNPTVVGLDPKLEFIPQYIKDKHDNIPNMFFEFNKAIIDEIHDLVPAVKPQIAMYEEYGIEGLICYIETVKYAKSKGLIVIGDAKRGDIASTAKSYSLGHLGDKHFSVDFLTVNPYMGYDSVEPFEDEMEKNDKGLFLLVKTSNPKSFQIQNLELKDGRLVYEEVAKLTQEWGEKFVGKHGFSSIGAVVGATHKEEIMCIRMLVPTVFFLVPGYGAQGGTAEDVAYAFNENGLGAIVNSSRGIIAAYRNEKYISFGEENFAKASRQAVIDMRDDIVSKINLK